MFRIFRPINLFILILTQYFLQYLVLLPAISSLKTFPILDHLHFALLVICTTLVAAGGYVVNDLLDYKSDLINKPNKVIIHQQITPKTGWFIYATTIILGGIIACYLAFYVHKPAQFVIYPSAVIVLYLYSVKLKKIPLIGNITVATFCAGVAALVLFAERESIQSIVQTTPSLAAPIIIIFTSYIIFAFLTTLLRELIKDIEDIEGDKLANANTYPVAFGIQNSKKVAIIIGLILLAGELLSTYWLFMHSEIISLTFFTVTILLPSCWLIYQIHRSSIKKDFTQSSKLIKTIMLAGLMLLSVIWKF